MGPVHAGRQLLHARGGARAAATDPGGEMLKQALDQARRKDSSEHEQPDDAEDGKGGLEQTVERNAEHETVLRQRFSGAEPNREGAGDREEAHGRDKRHEDGCHGLGQRDPGSFHDPYGHRRGPGLKVREVRTPGAETAGENHVAQTHARMDVTGAHPQSQAPADPVHRCEHQAHRDPDPMQTQKWGEEDIDAIAESNEIIAQEQRDPGQRNEGEQLEATTKETRG